jgi:uncharacterized protein involved in response to NO
MLFGFIAAAIAGFLLTAVPSWTGSRGFAGRPLLALTALWLLGRVLVATSVVWPQSLVAGIDLLFLPAVAGFVLPPIVRSGNRNTPLLAVLLALWATDVAFYWGLIHEDADLGRHALIIGIDVVMLLITIIGGRIIPAFTNAANRQRAVAPVTPVWRASTPSAVGAMLAVTIVDLIRPDSHIAGAAAAAAAMIQTARLAQWQGWRTLRVPLVWVLHLGYLWLCVGLALKAFALLTGLGFSLFYLHAFTIGAATTMIAAVMTRASLGHTGRPLVANRQTSCAYGLLTAAAAVRVFGPSLLPLPYIATIVLAALLWTGAFVLFLIVYAPVLLSPRADGKPG